MYRCQECNCEFHNSHYCYSRRRTVSFDEDFVISLAIGAITGSAILGTVLGGDIVGAVLGDMLDGDLFD